MASEVLRFNQVRAVKLPRSTAYIHNNLIKYNDKSKNVSYYAIINGLEVWIVKYSSEQNKSKKEPSVQLRKVPYDKIDRVSCVKWCRFATNITFIMATESGIVHVYDFEAKKILYSHDITANNIYNSNKNHNVNNKQLKPTVNCIQSDHKNVIFLGLSSGQLLSYEMDDNGLINKQTILQCEEAINCMTRPMTTNQNHNKNNKIYIGCDNGSVLQYDFYSNDRDILIKKSNPIDLTKNAIDSKNDDYYINNCGSCICIESCDKFIVCGFSSGHIKIIEKSDLSFIVKQIAMHRRMVTAISIYEEMGLICTVSEDGYAHVIRNSAAGSEVIRSLCFENSFLVGVEFETIKEKDNETKLKSISDEQKFKDKTVLITAYDRNRLVFV